MLRNVSNASPWLDHPSLVEVRSELLVGSKTGKKIGAFTMAVDIKRQRDKDAAEAGAPGAAGKAGAKPGAPAPAAAVPAASTAVLAPLAKPAVVVPPAKAVPAAPATAPVAPPVAASAPKAK
jgi:hypothetical protein